ncbi:MAG TPA: hypothetical protein VF327_06805, partial [Gaiellaceae bacterium]
MIRLAEVGGPVACVGLAVLLVARLRYGRLAGLGLAVVGTCLLGLGLAPNAPVKLAIGVAAVLAAAAGVAIAFRLVPWLLPLAALACIPVRIGVHVDGVGSKLLVPLYVVIIAAAMYLGWELVRGDERMRELGLAAWPLAAYL